MCVFDDTSPKIDEYYREFLGKEKEEDYYNIIINIVDHGDTEMLEHTFQCILNSLKNQKPDLLIAGSKEKVVFNFLFSWRKTKQGYDYWENFSDENFGRYKTVKEILQTLLTEEEFSRLGEEMEKNEDSLSISSGIMDLSIVEFAELAELEKDPKSIIGGLFRFNKSIYGEDYWMLPARKTILKL